MTPTNVEKRKEREEAEERSPLQIVFKRQKVAEGVTAQQAINSASELPPQKQPLEATIGANELASAFALASLATMSPTQQRIILPPSTSTSSTQLESRDADNDEGSELEQQQSAVPISPDVRSPIRSAQGLSRRVTFSDDTKVTSRITSRRLSLPPRVSSKQMQPSTRMPPGFSFGPNHYFPHHASRLTGQQNAPSLHPQWMRHPGMPQRHHGPPSLFLPSLHARSQSDASTASSGADHPPRWICDFCNVASFETYNEACVHEENCHARTGIKVPIPPSNPSSSWSPPHRRAPEHSYIMSHNRVISHVPPPNPMTSRAVNRMRRNMPPPPPPPMSNPVDSPPSSWSHGKGAVADSKTALSPRSSVGPFTDMDHGEASITHGMISNMGSVDMTEVEQSQGHFSDSDCLVVPDDVAMVPPYVYFLMRQVEITHFTEADRFVARSKGPVGFSGFQCRHCHGHAGLGKYFPVTAKSLSTNSTSQNIHSHLLKCRKVAPLIKEQLVALKEEKSKAPRLEPGWRRIFFERIWSRLHG